MALPKNTEYAGFWIRFLAYLIDSVLQLMVVFIIILPFFFLEEKLFAILGDLISLPITVYNHIILVVQQGGSVGKILLNLEIVDYKGKRLTYGRSTGRIFAHILSALPLCLGYIWIGIDEKKQSFHDKIAKTYVIKKKQTLKTRKHS